MITNYEPNVYIDVHIYKYAIYKISEKLKVRDGEILRKQLTINKISAISVAKKFNVNRSAVYKYFESETLSVDIKRRFLEAYDIDIDNEKTVNAVKDEPAKYTKRLKIDHLEEQIRIKDETIAKLSDTLSKLAAQLEKRLDK